MTWAFCSFLRKYLFVPAKKLGPQTCELCRSFFAISTRTNLQHRREYICLNFIIIFDRQNSKLSLSVMKKILSFVETYFLRQCCGSGMLIPDPNFPSRNPGPGSNRHRISDLWSLWNMIPGMFVPDPGSLIPDLVFFHPGSRDQKVTRSRIRNIRSSVEISYISIFMCLYCLLFRHEAIGDVRGRGLVQAVEMVECQASKNPAPALATQVRKYSQKTLNFAFSWKLRKAFSFQPFCTLY
jgi:hypothetical protein